MNYLKLLIKPRLFENDFNLTLTGSREELLTALKSIVNEVNDKKYLEKIDESILNKHLYTHFLPDVDLLIRTSGEKELATFLLWQIAYAELYFTEVLSLISVRKLYKADKLSKQRKKI